MRTITLLTTLLVILTNYAPAQYNGRCGSFRYTINGQLASSVEIDNITTKTYYSIDQKKGISGFGRKLLNLEINK